MTEGLSHSHSYSSFQKHGICPWFANTFRVAPAPSGTASALHGFRPAEFKDRERSTTLPEEQPLPANQAPFWGRGIVCSPADDEARLGGCDG